MSSTFIVSKLEMSKLSKLIECLNIFDILLTELVSNLSFKDVTDDKYSNINDISSTFEVSKLDMSKDVKDEHVENIPSIDLTCFVSNLETSKFSKSPQSPNI